MEHFHNLEVVTFKENELGFLEVIREFDRLTYLKYNKLLFDKELVTYADKFKKLKNEVFKYGKNDVKNLYYVLDKYGYDFKFDVIDVINLIAKQDNINLIKESVDYSLISPIINNVYFDDKNNVYMISSKLGKFKFMKLSDYLKTCKSINNQLIISTISSCFGGETFYSYIEDNNENIIDTENNWVMDKKSFNKLFNASEVTRLMNDTSVNRSM